MPGFPKSETAGWGFPVMNLEIFRSLAVYLLQQALNCNCKLAPALPRACREHPGAAGLQRFPFAVALDDFFLATTAISGESGEKGVPATSE
jgi:hypothetical protein